MRFTCEAEDADSVGNEGDEGNEEWDSRNET